MKNTIYNAIQNQLIIDSDNDSGISYKRSDIDSGIQRPVVGCMYDLSKLFRNGTDPFTCDSINTISLIFADETEHPIYDHNGNEVFLKITNQMLKHYDSEILIALNNDHYIYDHPIIWKQNVNTPEMLKIYDYSEAVDDYRGYEHTQTALEISKISREYQKYRALGIYPAIEYSNRQSIFTEKSRYKGYVPAYGQLSYIKDNIRVVNYIINQMGYAEIPMNKKFWSSTRRGTDETWTLSFETVSNTWDNYVFPLFKRVD